MKRSEFLKQALMVPAISNTFLTTSESKPANQKTYKVRLLRNATLIVETGELKFLVDPMLGKKDSMDPVKNAANSLRIPMVDLPISDDELKQLIGQTDAILLTHTHRDHWDEPARQLIPKDKMLFCQPQDEQKLKEQGFANVKPVSESIVYKNISIHRTEGQHGTGEIGKQMAPVSGFVLENNKEKLYIAGDTIYCDEVEQAIRKHNPQSIIVNAGGAQFLTGGPIIMNVEDVIRTANQAKGSRIVAVHMEAVNHCLLSRAQLREAVKKAGLDSVHVPGDGEWAQI
jgi:L-ascorbate metabolism protein UlaG (beta-lactamase superfamily)